MNRLRSAILGLALLAAAPSPVLAQNQYIGYVYPAGGQRGTTFPIRLGGQGLLYASDLVVTGEGVSVRLVDYYRVLGNQEMSFLRQQLNELKKKGSTVSDAMAARMDWFEFPAPIGPIDGGNRGWKWQPAKSDKEAAKEKLIERIQERLAENQYYPAVPSQREIVFAEVTVAPDAKPGRREIRVITKRGISNPLPFYVGQLPEVARKPMKTAEKPVLGKEYLALRHRPPQEEEQRITAPCTMNGQIAFGEVNRYRFTAKKGQRLVISAKARDLVPYVPDAVPGWFQAVLKLCDAHGREVAYDDDYRFNPDPIIYYTVPKDGEYVLSIYDALFRGRESFVYRITIGELPFVTSVFPLGGRVGAPLKVEMDGWNLEKATLSLPVQGAKPGIHPIAASKGKFISNYVPFALDTLPECLEKEPNDDPAHAQKVQLPIIINGRIDRPGDWDVFELDGKAGETIVAEVWARRLGSPLDSFLKVTNAAGKIIALNDDHYDAASGFNTDYADSYLMVKLPADGKYFVHLADTRRHAGKEYAYRLRISRPQPDFVLRVVPSQIVLRSRSSAAVTVYAVRKDGFEGPIKLSFQNLPAGLESPGAILGAKKEVVRLGLKTSVKTMERPVNLTVVGIAKIGNRQVVHEAVPAEDMMQAFLWRHLLPAETLPALVFDPSYQPPADRVHTPIRDRDRPKGVARTLTRSSVDWYLRQVEDLYQDWLLTDEFANREIATTEARLIQ